MKKKLTFQQAFGRAVKARRAEVGMNQQELANKLQLNITMVSRYEMGTGNTNMDRLALIAKILKCSPTELIQRAEKIWMTSK